MANEEQFNFWCSECGGVVHGTRESHRIAFHAREHKFGTVEKVEFTRGGFGNQWTTIDGIRYATWWDIRQVNVQVGARVEYVAQLNAKIWDSPLTYADTAHVLRVVQS